MEDFLKKNGCEASAGDVEAFLKERQAKTGELSDDELNNVAGGCNKDEALLPLGSMGLGCALFGTISAASHKSKGDHGKSPVPPGGAGLLWSLGKSGMEDKKQVL